MPLTDLISNYDIYRTVARYYIVTIYSEQCTVLSKPLKPPIILFKLLHTTKSVR